MHTPFDSSAERALFELAAAMPYIEQPRTLDSCFLFSFSPHPPSWTLAYAARFIACRFFAIVFCIGALAFLPMCLLALAGAHVFSAASETAKLGRAMRACERIRGACHGLLRRAHRLFDDLLFCFDPSTYAKFCYARLACYWTRGVCAPILPASPGLFSPTRVDSPWSDELSADLLRALQEGNRHAHRWCLALRDSCMGPADFDEVDRRWERSLLPGTWSPSSSAPSYATLRLACAELAELESPLFKPSGQRARLLASRSEGADIESHIQAAPPGPGAKRL